RPHHGGRPRAVRRRSPPAAGTRRDARAPREAWTPSAAPASRAARPRDGARRLRSSCLRRPRRRPAPGGGDREERRRPDPLVAVVELGYTKADRVEQVDEVVPEDLLLLHQHVRDPVEALAVRRREGVCDYLAVPAVLC